MRKSALRAKKKQKKQEPKVVQCIIKVRDGIIAKL